MNGGTSGLTTLQRVSLAVEVETARQFLVHGVVLLRGRPSIDQTLDVLLLVWHMGAERLLKVLYGLTELEQGRPWPEMQRTISHRVVKADQLVRDHLHSWAASTPGNAYPNGLIAAVDADPIVPSILAALDDYGSGGRFFWLDQLRQSPQQRDRPDAVWDQALTAARDSDPSVAARFWDNVHNHPDRDHMRELHDLVSKSMVRWWSMLARTGQWGAFGDLGKQLATSFGPATAIPPVELIDS